MAVTVSYELSLEYTVPEELLEKMDELNEYPEPVSLDSDGMLTVELDSEEEEKDYTPLQVLTGYINSLRYTL